MFSSPPADPSLVEDTPDGEVRRRLADELARVERCFSDELVSGVECVNRLVRHVDRYRGKMLRPTLVLGTGLAARDGAELVPAHRTVATVVELVHMATLVHDDILDEAEVRRSGQTVNRLNGNEAAVMLGDYLISHAYRLCSSIRDQRVSERIGEVTNTVCEGELLQLDNRHNWDLAESTYFEIIDRKTASLCGVCCELGAALHGCPEERVSGLYRFGQKLGTAFQIVDDILDLTGDEATTGKTLGRDLEKGKLTLPLIDCLRVGTPEVRAQVRPHLETPGPDSPGHLREMLAGGGHIARARRRAEALVREAQSEVADLPASPARELLNEMAEAVLRRDA